MTKVETYRCDRCQKDFTKDIGSSQFPQSKVILEDHDIAWALKAEENSTDLCEDCVTRFYSWKVHDKDIDAFIDSKQKQWDKEDSESDEERK